MMEEDPSLEMHRDPQTREMILSGVGQLHIEVVVERLKRKYGVEVELKAPKVPYKETIKGRAKAQGKLKKQTGGRGQFGDAWLEVEPLPRGTRLRVRRRDRRRRRAATVHPGGREGRARSAAATASSPATRSSTSG